MMNQNNDFKALEEEYKKLYKEKAKLEDLVSEFNNLSTILNLVITSAELKEIDTEGIYWYFDKQRQKLYEKV